MGSWTIAERLAAGAIVLGLVVVVWILSPDSLQDYPAANAGYHGRACMVPCMTAQGPDAQDEIKQCFEDCLPDIMSYGLRVKHVKKVSNW